MTPTAVDQLVAGSESQQGTCISSRPPSRLLDDRVTTGYHVHAEFDSDDEDYDLYSQALPAKKPYVLPALEDAERLAAFLDEGVDTAAYDPDEHVQGVGSTQGTRYVSSVCLPAPLMHIPSDV